MNRPAISLFFFAILACCMGFAQQSVHFPGNGAVPPTEQLRGRTNNLLYAMVVTPGAVLRTDPGSTAQALPHRTQFREVLAVYAESPDHQYLLVNSKKNNAVWGWIAKSSVLYDVFCQRSEDKDNRAYMKVTLKNSLKVDNLKKVDVFGGPGPSYGVLETKELAQILFVFDKKTGADGNEYFLLGWDSEWDPDATVEESSIRGWVRRDQCTVWDSRVAVFYDRKPHPEHIKIYDTREGLLKKDANDVLATETTSSEASLTYDRTRFPVVQRGTTQSGSILPMKIAFIGDPQRNVKAALANEIKQAARNMQVLFVIDGTISMGKYFREVQTAVQQYIESLATAQDKAKYHFAVAVYRDYEDAKDGGDAEIVADFDDQAALEKLGSLKERSDPSDHTLEEAVFNGIVRSVSRVSWKPANTKVVVVIGDHPNHPLGQDGEKYTASRVVTELKQLAKSKGLDSGFLLNAINVNVKESTRRLNDEFVRQMTQIGAGMQQFDPDHSLPAGIFPQLKNEDQDMNHFRQDVTAVLGKVVTTSQIAVNIIADFQKGDTPDSVDKTYGTEYVNLALQILREGGIQKLQEIDQSGITQLSQEGWVDQKSVEPWVYIDRNTFDEFEGFLAALLRTAEHPAGASQMLKSAVESVSGDEFRGQETIKDFNLRANAIPFRDDSVMLSKTPEQLQQALDNPVFRTEFLKRVGYSYEVLRLVGQERDPAALRWDDGKRKWFAIDNPKQVKSWVTSNGGEVYCWVPLAFMP